MFLKDENQSITSGHVALYRTISFTFLGLTLAAIVVILFFAFSSATITIQPVKKDFPSDFQVSIKKIDDEYVSLNNSQPVKGRILTTTKESSKEFLTSVVSSGQPGKASGMVTLINKSTRPQALVATTRLLSDSGVLFRLAKAVTVPAKGEISAKVIADKPGKEGDIGISTFTIPGLLPARQKEVFAKSEQPMTGGIKVGGMLTDVDLKNAQDSLSADLAKESLAEWQSELPLDLPILENTLFTEALSSLSDANINDKVDRFTLKLKLRVVVLAINDKEIIKLASVRLKDLVPSGNELVKFDENSLKYKADRFDDGTQTLTLKLTLTGQTQLRSSSPSFDRSKLAGATIDKATAYLKGIDGVAEVQIKVSPSFFKTLPLLKDHIHIVISQ